MEGKWGRRREHIASLDGVGASLFSARKNISPIYVTLSLSLRRGGRARVSVAVISIAVTRGGLRYFISTHVEGETVMCDTKGLTAWRISSDANQKYFGVGTDWYYLGDLLYLGTARKAGVEKAVVSTSSCKHRYVYKAVSRTSLVQAFESAFSLRRLSTRLFKSLVRP